MGWFANWRRRKILRERPLSEALWARAVSPYAFIAALDKDETRRLRDLVVLFLDEKQLHGAANFGISDEARIAIAAQACLPVLNLGLEWYAGWVGVIVYPGEFKVARTIVDDDGVVHEFDDALSGEAWPDGPVVLSWQDAAMTDAGYNVVIHEFAHKLDMAQGEDEVPLPRPGMDADAWREVFESAYAEFCAEVETSDDTLVDPYAAEHPAEFFAVMSEMFFTHSAVLARDWPELYQQFTHYYHQDPAGIFDADGAAVSAASVTNVTNVTTAPTTR